MNNLGTFYFDLFVQLADLIFPVIGAIIQVPKGKENKTMNNYLFEDTIDGGFFFVQCDTEDEAWSIVWEEIACDHPCCDYDTYTMYYDYLGCYTDEQAEQMGYDTY